MFDAKVKIATFSLFGIRCKYIYTHTPYTVIIRRWGLYSGYTRETYSEPIVDVIYTMINEDTKQNCQILRGYQVYKCQGQFYVESGQINVKLRYEVLFCSFRLHIRRLHYFSANEVVASYM